MRTHLMMMSHDAWCYFSAVLSCIFAFCHGVQVQNAGQLDLAFHGTILVEIVVDGVFVVCDSANSEERKQR